MLPAQPTNVTDVVGTVSLLRPPEPGSETVHSPSVPLHMLQLPGKTLPVHGACCCRGTYDLIGRVYASGGMGVPLTLGVLSGDAGERVVYGDSRGSAVLLLCGSRELPPRDLITTETHKVSRHGRRECGAPSWHD
jgi:hypothetical protein